MSDAAERLFERVLVLRCQTGEPVALAELIARYGPRLRFYLRKMAGDAAVDDLLQDVWIDVFANVARLNDPAAFAAWVYRIARDKAYRLLRARRVPLIELDDELCDVTSDDEDEWTPDDAAAVRAALDKLPAAHREVLLLQFVEEMTYEQIAALTACPVGTVRSRIHYAKRALRAAIERTTATKDERQ
jgi:RNA polymerase sigma-70 factor (ECF subfamily)